MNPRRRGCALRRRYGRRAGVRYGCFRLPKIPGAQVSESRRKDVSWLARTDPEGKTIEFSEYWNHLQPEEKRYIVLHERAHLATGPDHDTRFYDELKKLVAANGVDWKVAYALEAYNCHKDH